MQGSALALANRVQQVGVLLRHVPGIVLAVLLSRLRRDGDADLVLCWLLSVNAVGARRAAKAASQPPLTASLRLYSWDLSYFSAKVRGFLRYKSRLSGLTFEEVVATPHLIQERLLSSTGSSTVPQVEFPDGRVVQDSTEIMEVVDRLFPEAPALPAVDSRPRQCLACHIVELLADEWLLVPAFHWRWAYSGDGSPGQRMPTPVRAGPTPNHREWNELQWGSFLRPDGSEAAKRRTARWLFDNMFFKEAGIKGAMVCLGVTRSTVAAWEASCKNILGILEGHLAVHDFVLGSRPSTADFALLGPLYAHLYRDPVPHAMMCKDFPRVAVWCERCHDRGCAAAELDSRSAPKVGDWLPNDEVPETVMPLLQVFLDEMWPVLKSTCEVLKSYLNCGGYSGGPLPGKSFSPTSMDQQGFGPLVHDFSLPFDADGKRGGSSSGRRMVIPYQVWMLQRLEPALRADVRSLLEQLGPRGGELLGLPALLEGCRVRKAGGLIHPQASVARPPRRWRRWALALLLLWMGGLIARRRRHGALAA